MSSLVWRPDTEPGATKSEDLTETSGWRGLLWLPALISSALGLLIPTMLYVFVLPGHQNQVVTEVYRDRVWEGPDWTLYLIIGMAIGLLFGIAGIVLATASLVLPLRSAKDPKTSKLRYGPFLVGTALGAITLFINALLFIGSFIILP